MCTALRHSRSKGAKLQLKDRCLQLAFDQKILYAEALLPGLIYAKNALQAASYDCVCTTKHGFMFTPMGPSQFHYPLESNLNKATTAHYEGGTARCLAYLHPLRWPRSRLILPRILHRFRTSQSTSRALYTGTSRHVKLLCTYVSSQSKSVSECKVLQMFKSEGADLNCTD